MLNIAVAVFAIDLVRPQDTYQFFVKHGELKVYKTLDTPYFSTGKLILGPQEEKGKQHVGPDILVSLFLHLCMFCCRYNSGFFEFDQSLKFHFLRSEISLLYFTDNLFLNLLNLELVS